MAFVRWHAAQRPFLLSAAWVEWTGNAFYKFQQGKWKKGEEGLLSTITVVLHETSKTSTVALRYSCFRLRLTFQLKFVYLGLLHVSNEVFIGKDTFVMIF